MYMDFTLVDLCGPGAADLYESEVIWVTVTQSGDKPAQSALLCYSPGAAVAQDPGLPGQVYCWL